ncbi:Uncharacterised protein [Vibrio cholerae]|nr:Uncharacterised protein [Vibrio cholerae]
MKQAQQEMLLFVQTALIVADCLSLIWQAIRFG